ncbi:MAG: hypothetical protein FWH03_07385 [Firmicutes bacterium]|nr:hypothetical protein [Bacillota bacterium]
MKINKRKIGIFFAVLLMLSVVFTAVGCRKTETFTVEVSGGTGGGSFNKNASCTVTATLADGEEFVRWTDGEGEEVSTQNPYTFNVTQSITLTAVTGPRTQHTVTVTNGFIGTDRTVRSASVYSGDSVTLTASATQARRFNKWIINGTTESTQNPLTLAITADTTVQAILDEILLLVVSNGTVNGKTYDLFDAGSEVTVVADEFEDASQRFFYWYIVDEDENETEVSRSPEYTFTLAESLKIFARYARYFTLSVVDGYIGDNPETSSLEVAEGDFVSVTPINPPNATPGFGNAFRRWTQGADTLSTSFTYVHRVTQAETLTAVFEEISTQIQLPAIQAGTSNGLIHRETINAQAIAFDRVATMPSIFLDGADHVRVHIYDSSASSVSLGHFKLVLNTATPPDTQQAGWFMSTDETIQSNFKGQTKNYYLEGAQFSDFERIVRHALGYEYSDSGTYYFAMQAAAPQGGVAYDGGIELTVNDGAISGKSTWMYQRNASAPAGKFTVELVTEGALIDGQYTSVEAGYGVLLTLTVPPSFTEEGAEIFGWFTALPDGQGGYTSGGVLLSGLATFYHTVTGNVTLMVAPVGEDIQVLPAPDNTNNAMININPPGAVGQIRYDRQSGGTAFVTGVDYIMYYVVTDTNPVPIPAFRLVKNPDGSAYLTDANGNPAPAAVQVAGGPGNYSTPDGNTHNWLKPLLTYHGVENFYFVCQAVSESPLFLNSEIGLRGQAWYTI